MKTCESSQGGALSPGTSQEEAQRRGSRWGALSAVSATMGTHAASAVNNANSTASVEPTVNVRSLSERTVSDQEVELGTLTPTRDRSGTDATGYDNDPVDVDVTTFENADEDI